MDPCVVGGWPRSDVVPQRRDKRDQEVHLSFCCVNLRVGLVAGDKCAKPVRKLCGAVGGRKGINGRATGYVGGQDGTEVPA